MAVTSNHSQMTNDEFIKYLSEKRDALFKEQKEGKDVANHLALVISALRIMQNSPGPAARRFKRDYLRRLAKQGVKL